MLERIALEDAAGKVLAASTKGLYESPLILVFEGGFYTLIESSCSESGSAYLHEEPFNFKFNEFSDSELIRIGMTTEEEISGIREAEKARQAARTEAAERANYERLRKKFGDAS